MDLEIILKQIKTASGREVQKILAEGQKQVDALLQKARDDVEGSRQRILNDGEYRQQREKAIIMRQGAMESLRLQAEVHQKLIDAAMQEASEKLDKLYSMDGYADILVNFTKEALAELSPSLLPGQKAILRFDPKDRRVPLPKFEIEDHVCECIYDLKTKGGCIAQSEDGKVVVDNTIEARIKNGLPKLRQKMWQLFEKYIRA